MIHIIYLSIIFILLMLVYVQYKLRESDRKEYKDLEECFENLSRQHSKTADNLQTQEVEYAKCITDEMKLNGELRAATLMVDLLNARCSLLRTEIVSLKARLQPYSEIVDKVDRREKK